MVTPKFDADFFELPDGTVTVAIRAHWPSADDVVEVLGQSVRRGPKRVGGSLRQAEARCE
jgi:hypothetical protein